MNIYYSPGMIAACFRCHRQIELKLPEQVEPTSIPRWMPTTEMYQSDCREKSGHHCTPHEDQ